jgi:hypothetical protein
VRHQTSHFKGRQCFIRIACGPSIAGPFFWSFLRRFDPDISPVESDAYLRPL